ncbi:hypothetical protein MCAP1_000948 [Malassezia caprae]|uniref:Uncharacterized protein n=1 Tax=Malassezia caprae TaxID=1381934 RepID=A0AAF0E9U3_9BASI|nr:hypothetical protein MCAP1_000948 [Malassezia caprae]
MSGASTAGMSPRLRKRPSGLLEVSTCGSGASYVSDAELVELEESIAELRRQPSADSFSRIVNEISTHRRLQKGPRHRRSFQSFASSDDGRSSHSRLSSVDEDTSVSGVMVRPCCCQQPDCEVARRVLQHMQDMEMDLQLSAEIGQALLQRQDAIVHRSQQESEDHALQRDQLLARLTQSIKETQSLQRQLTQAQFNLEAADQSHHALLSELEDARRQMKHMKMHRIKASNLEAKLERAEIELEDTRAELRVEQRRTAEASAQHQRLVARRCVELSDLLQDSIREEASSTEDAYAKAWNAVRVRLDAARASDDGEAEQDDDLDAILQERAVLQKENTQLQQLLRGAQEEIQHLREVTETSSCEPTQGPVLSADLQSASDTSHTETATDGTRGSDGTVITTPSTSRANLDEDNCSYDTGSLQGIDFELALEHRTGLLGALIEAMHRTYTKLQQADIDTLSARLQRQKLAGDVGHLSRTTVQASVRDAEGFKEHFRKMVEKEARRGVHLDGSLVTRRDFFALVKLQRESLLELARLRRCINEIQLQPHAASKLLHEYLGAQTHNTGRSWISRMFTGVLSTETPAAPAEPSAAPVPSAADSSFVRVPTTDAATPAAAVPMAMPRRNAAPPTRMLPRTGTAALSTSVAVHAHGMHAAGKPGILKAKASQPSLADAAQRAPRRPLANITNAAPAARPWEEPLKRSRARGLSDSSIHSTFLEHGAAAHDPPVDRVITTATLTLSGHDA